ncbi:DNA-methyltransferase [Lactiplantibacillus plantarum]|uniref:DNA-methyltransferase n=1 Tax=Lactiplantibacillus plantarum TaxID=1590 RepID=UPI0011CB4B8D|nr:site-specific DNA-methyltransferase [Lactiplantibacillus plantarum]MCW6147757.1 site-specific DNA-methyltransferase [Lactiplantibacillus plantarum]TXJ69125.1 site-specific DNA-methyltransferase [Lactiplantibacillus plantarum]TXJ73196.1 site-specific DNA-methyltransferase [Lactiplantibacillus plantarum]TXJ96493.1 site-specific DNA-methyltransferase [Lactiplantibacillus plantarum]
MIDLQQGDCLELMKGIPDGSVDMILCDLPYGTTANKWDVVIPFEPLWQQYRRIIKTGSAIILFATEPFASKLRLSNCEEYKYDWIWNKKKGGNIFNLKRQPYKIHENILVFHTTENTYHPIMIPQKERTGKIYSKTENFKTPNYQDTRTYKFKNPQSILTFSNANQHKVHPTQKPVQLLEYLIKTYTHEGGTVLDNCMGSGSTGVACVNTGRSFIGMELDEEYFKIAEQRINEARRNVEFF